MTYGYPVLGDIEMLAGSPREAEAILVELCGRLERTGSWNHLATRAADLAEALCSEGRYDDAQRWADVSAIRSANGDLATAIRLTAVQSTLFAASGDPESAMRSARRAVGLAATTDALNLQGKALTALSTALSARGDDLGAREAIDQAKNAYEAKGNLAALAAMPDVGRQETLKAR
jgi:tetratricopeptide (TPR) repeat protein